MFLSIILVLAIVVLLVASLWKTFEKAGEPGWAAIVPLYNVIVILKMADKPWWWLFLLLIPVVNVVLLFVVYIQLAKNFGQSTLFGVAMVFFSAICFPILGFGPAQFKAGQNEGRPDVIDSSI